HGRRATPVAQAGAGRRLRPSALGVVRGRRAAPKQRADARAQATDALAQPAPRALSLGTELSAEPLALLPLALAQLLDALTAALRLAPLGAVVVAGLLERVDQLVDALARLAQADLEE